MKAGRFFSIAVGLPAVFLFLMSPLSVSAARKNTTIPKTVAKDRTTMVEGHIADVTPQAIGVNGSYYYFTGVPIVNQSGQRSAPNQLITGREVKVFFRNGIVSEIMVYDRPVIQ